MCSNQAGFSLLKKTTHFKQVTSEVDVPKSEGNGCERWDVYPPGLRRRGVQKSSRIQAGSTASTAESQQAVQVDFSATSVTCRSN